MPSVAGDATRLLERLALRYAAVVHGAVGVSCGLVGLVSAEPAMRWRAAGLVALVIGWGGFYSWRLLRGSATWLVVADVAVVAFVAVNLGVTERLEVLAVGAGWVISWASFVCVSYQLHTSVRLGFGATVVVDLAIAVGAWRAAPQYWTGWVVGLIWLLVSAGLSRWLWVLVRRGGTLADQAAEETSRVRREREVATAVRADEQRAVRMLHDTSSTTLLMIGAGYVRPTDDWLPDQAARDLAALSRVPEVLPSKADRDLGQALREVTESSPLTIRLEGDSHISLPGDVVAALADAVHEALSNVLRHSGRRTATCRVSQPLGAVQIEVIDDGVGFHGAADARRGITHSIVETLQAVGGSAQFESQLGRGTTVRLLWQAKHRSEPTDEAAVWQANLAGSTTSGLHRQLRLATLIITAAVLYLLAPATLFSNRAEYDSIAVQLIAFGLLSLVFVTGAILFERDLSWGRWRWAAIAVIAAAGLLSASGVEHTAHALASNWFVGTAPWLALVVLGERLKEVVTVLAINHLIAIGRMLTLPVDGVETGYLAGMITSAGYPLAVAVATSLLASLAQQAAQQRRDAEEVRIADQLAAQTHERRQRRYAELSATAGPLLAGLADGTLDPQDESVRRRCAIEAARMRRIFAEHDETPDPLLHELRACADLADRRGVLVTLATAGTWAAPPLPVRRGLTEGPLMLLATAASQARITVSSTDGSLAVSVVADAPDIDVPLPVGHNVHLSTTRHDGLLWVEAQWASRSSQ
ncbi:ATP-binding protein [Kribbella sp. NPDC050820]|uniref:sensor histidine kinase n=1 Tax=Kribbella sp. NPDC050820 TaxID=3155408 RepID=UPI0033E8EBC9